MSRSDGSTADYYQLPDGCTELQHLISQRDMNAQIGEIFRACYRYGQASHSDRLRDAKKILFYAKAEVARLERLESHRSHPMTPNVWDETRADVIGQNGNDGEHYASASDGAGVWTAWYGGECPVDGDARVEVEFCDGEQEQGKAEGFWWNYDGTSGDIIRYRLL